MKSNKTILYILNIEVMVFQSADSNSGGSILIIQIRGAQDPFKRTAAVGTL